MRTGKSVHYKVHPTPLKPGETLQTYHVRQVMKSTVDTHELAEYLTRNGNMSVGIFEMVMDRLNYELKHLLISGHDVHINGLGFFSLQLGIKKEIGPDGRKQAISYLNPDELTADKLTIEGINFRPDKQMLKQLLGIRRPFVREKGDYVQSVGREEMISKLKDFCRQHGSFTRTNFEHIFGVSRYRAQQELDALISEPSPVVCRRKAGSAYIYRLTDVQE